MQELRDQLVRTYTTDGSASYELDLEKWESLGGWTPEVGARIEYFAQAVEGCVGNRACYHGVSWRG